MNRTPTIPSMKVRRTTFAFDLLHLDFGDYDVRLLPVEGKTPEQQVEEYLELLYGDQVPPNHTIIPVVERHRCKYDNCTHCGTELLVDAAIGDVLGDMYCSEYCRDIVRQRERESAWGIPTTGDFGQPGTKEEHST